MTTETDDDHTTNTASAWMAAAVKQTNYDHTKTMVVYDPTAARVRFFWKRRFSEMPVVERSVKGAEPMSRATRRRAVPKPMTVWPATLRLDQAAEYSGLSVDTFKLVCPVRPIEFTESSRGHRYLKAKLDEWLTNIDPNTPTSLVRRFGEKLGG